MVNSIEKIRCLVEKLNEYRDAYYNHNDSPVTDEVYDRLFDELKQLEVETGIVMANSPTNTVGYRPVSELKKVNHPVALLSMDKTKSVDDLVRFIGDKEATVMYKLDGLTVRLDYEDGKLVLAATWGDGSEGDDITHNIPAFMNVPLTIPYKERLSVSGEAFIHRYDFERINEGLSEDKRFSTCRNMAAGSVRAYDPKICKSRNIFFNAFKVIEGFEEINSKYERMSRLQELGFPVCPIFKIETGSDMAALKNRIAQIREDAQISGIPIDGAIVQYDDVAYSKSRGATGHHYKDGIAFKFEDELYKTVLRDIEWNTSRSGCMVPKAVYDMVEIDGCAMTHATLHNVSFVKKLDLHVGDRILISKRNMIIPAVEANMDAGKGNVVIPNRCSFCGAPTVIRKSADETGKDVEKLYCTNPACGSSLIKQFVHFVDKDSMNIEGLAEGIIEKLITAGLLAEFTDIYDLEKHRDEIIGMDGFGEKSYDKLIAGVRKSSSTTMNKFLRAVDIPLLGRHASKTISDYFKGDIAAFEDAILGDKPFDFTALEGIGETLHQNIYEWFAESENITLWKRLRCRIAIVQPKIDTEKEINDMLKGKIVVVTGTVEGYTRSEMDSLIAQNGGIAGGSVTGKTDILVIGEKPGGFKVKKAEALGTKMMTAEEFLKMLNK